MEKEMSPLEELEIRIQNQETIIVAAQMELEALLKEKERLTKHKPI
jgi:hypothetical protein